MSMKFIDKTREFLPQGARTTLVRATQGLRMREKGLQDCPGQAD